MKNIYVFLAILTLASLPFVVSAQNATLLSSEEVLWLKSRNNTIVVYPEKGFPPFSYQSTAGIPQGLSIDYIELIAEKIGTKIVYLPARPLSQVLEDVKLGKGDVVTSIARTPDREEFLYFTDEYLSVSTVIVVRKDFNEKKTMNVSDLIGKKVAVGNGYAVAEFLHKNYPRIILDQVTDDEVALQQVVLGEVDAAVMDIASLSFYMSKQVLNSVKVIGNAGYEYKLAFAIPKDKQILQSIIDKGLMQISQTERQIFSDKWIIVPGETAKEDSFWSKVKNIFAGNYPFIFIISCLIVIIFFLARNKYHHGHYLKRKHVDDLKEDLEKLEEANETLSEEMKMIQKEENKIRDKIEKLDK